MATAEDVYYKLLEKNLGLIKNYYLYTNEQMEDFVLFINEIENKVREMGGNQTKLEITYFSIKNYFETFDWNYEDLKRNIIKVYIEEMENRLNEKV